MEQTIKAVQQQINERGGIKAAALLSRIFPEGFAFGKEFDGLKVFNDIWNKISSHDSGNTSEGHNVIPHMNRNNNCSLLCLTVVQRGFKNPNKIDHNYPYIDFTDAMLLQSEHWFNCLNINEENLFLTPDWRQDLFEARYEQLIESYCNHHGSKVFVVEVARTGLILRYPY